jgi:PEP-CTERM motif
MQMMQMMQMIKRIQVAIAAAILVAASVTTAAAAPIVFTNEAHFNTAVAAAGLTLGLESFESRPSGPNPMPLDLGAFTVTAPLPTLAITDNPLHVTHGTKALAVSPAFQPITFTFDTAIRAFSIDVVDQFNIGGGTFFGRIGTGAQQTFFNGGAAPGVGARAFLGILDLDAAFTTLQLDGDGGLSSFILDRVQYAEGDANPTPVPEPASLTLLAAGLLAGARRLRARRAGAAR